MNTIDHSRGNKKYIKMRYLNFNNIIENSEFFVFHIIFDIMHT